MDTATEPLWKIACDAASAIGGVGTLLLAIYIFWVQSRENKRLKHLETLHSNGTMLNEAWRQLVAAPEALCFHGLNEEALKKAGFTINQLVYLLISFQAADYYYQHKDKKTGAFSTRSLRYAMLANSETRRAWPFMKPFFVASDRYVQRIEATIQLFDSPQ